MATHMRVSLPLLNLYAQPQRTREVISQALYGWNVLVLEKHQEFNSIQTPDGYSGWVDARGLSSCPSLKHPLKKVKMRYNAVPVYPDPHVKNQPLWILPFEVECPILTEPAEEEGRWIQIHLVDGTAGWVQRGHVSCDFSPLTLAQMLELSHQFLNIPYIWGGTSSFGYDCSGFVQMLWRQRGVVLPRDARQQIQAAVCYPVAWEYLEPGNLLFYGSCADDIRHVGLYLGRQTLIHSSVKPLPLVQESLLDEPTLQQRFAYRTARRVVL